MNNKAPTGRVTGAVKAPTESDVAKLAGVSQSAVSRAFTPGASVAETTREIILKAARELGYQPNLLARSLATNKSDIIALAISYLENPFYAQVVKELSEKLRDTGRHLLLVTIPPNESADKALERVLSYQVDAIVMTATTASLQLAAQCQKSGVPIVQINRPTSIPGISTVRGENRTAAERVAQFLISGGHKNYAFIGGPEDSSTSNIRLDSFKAELKRAGFEPVQTAYGDYTFEAAAAAARDLLGRDVRPDAIFCASDYMAFAVLDVAKREFGLQIPRDLSVVGFDDVPEASHSAYDLTTFSQPAAALVEEAIRIIDLMLAVPSRPVIQTEVRGQVIVRGSARIG